MYIFDTIKKRLEPKTIVDPTFGRLRWTQGWWVGNLVFEPTGEEIEVSAEADDQGPTEAQRVQFTQLRERYHSLQEAVSEKLYELVTNRQEDYPREQVSRDFTLEGVSIYGPDAAMPDFELSYGWAPDESFSYGVFIQNWRPDGVAIHH